MSSIFGVGLGLFMAIPILIAQWLGVLGLAKNGRNPAWWWMAVGTGLTTLGTILTPVLLWVAFSLDSFGESMLLLTGTGAMTGLGSLVFVVGFAMHGMKSRKVMERVVELESVLAAQQEQLSRENPGDRS